MLYGAAGGVKHYFVTGKERSINNYVYRRRGTELRSDDFQDWAENWKTRKARCNRVQMLF